MAKKKEDKVEAAPVETVTTNREEFKQSRDKFLSTFVLLQDAINDLMSNYINHTNKLLGEPDSSLSSILKDLRNIGELPGNVATTAGRSASPDKSDSDKKKERKKRVHDPNAPKRPLTPFFLYMQTARPIITMDLGPDAAKGAVAEEGTRRWGVMGTADRASWSSAYHDNLKLYQARMHSYKQGGNVDAKNMTDDEARVYWDDHLAGVADNLHADVQLANEALANNPDAEIDADVNADVDAEGEAESEEEVAPPVAVRTPTPPPKTPKVKASRKKATPKTETPVVAPVPPPAVAAAPAAKPEAKRKRKTKAEIDREKAASEKAALAETPVETIEREELAVQTPAPPKSSSRPKKKKAKTDA